MTYFKTLRPLFFSSFLFSIAFCNAQTLEKTAKDAFAITRVIEKNHFSPKKIDSAFSQQMFTSFLEILDADKLVFTTKDIEQLSFFNKTLHLQILNSKTDFLALCTKLYTNKLNYIDSTLNQLKSTSITFSVQEKIPFFIDTNFAFNNTLLKQKLLNNIKNTVIEEVVSEMVEEEISLTNIKYFDSLCIAKKNRFLAFYIRQNTNKTGMAQKEVCEAYCEAIATCNDPHTQFFSSTQRENFEAELGKKSMVFGITLKPSNTDGVEIQKIAAGSAAYKSGAINKGDKIVSIQWQNSKTIFDATKASLAEVYEVLAISNNEKATFVVQKNDGSKQTIVLGKETNNNDEDKVISFVLKGAKNVGYILLPAFYNDWENETNIVGCSNDVAKEILKLKKENIDALIIDVRYNGGGSLQEAIDLVGLFIDAGPVAQIQYNNAKTITLKDVNRGTVFDGPMAVLVNGFSASASELFAGALQDYNRALIVGSNTFGKATGQAIFPLDTTNTAFDASKLTGDAIKITKFQLYQVSGKTAQFYGVAPDIELIDRSTLYPQKEKNLDNALPAKSITANKYYIPNKRLPIEAFQKKAVEYLDNEDRFATLKKQLDDYKSDELTSKNPVTIQKYYSILQQQFNSYDGYKKEKPSKKYFDVYNIGFDEAKLKFNTDLQENYNQLKKKLETDLQLSITFKLLAENSF